MWSYGWYFHGHQQDSLIRIFLGILHILSRVYNKIVAYYAPTYTALHKTHFDTYKSTNPEIEGNVLKTYNNMQSQ